MYIYISKTRGASWFLFQSLSLFNSKKNAGQTDLALHGRAAPVFWPQGFLTFTHRWPPGNRRLHLRRWQNLPPIGERRQTRPDVKRSKHKTKNIKKKEKKQSNTITSYHISVMSLRFGLTAFRSTFRGCFLCFACLNHQFTWIWLDTLRISLREKIFVLTRMMRRQHGA